MTDAYLKELQEIEKKQQNSLKVEGEGKITFTESEAAGEAEAEKDTPDVPLRPSEKRRLHWKGLTCGQSPFFTRHAGLIVLHPDLAPLTTVGNLVCLNGHFIESIPYATSLSSLLDNCVYRSAQTSPAEKVSRFFPSFGTPALINVNYI